MHRACDVSVAGLQSRYASPDITPTCKEKEKRRKKRFLSCKTGGRVVLCAERSARSGRLFLFAATRVGRSGEEGIMGDGVRWSEVAAGESRSASQRRRVGRGCQPQVPAQAHEDHCV